MNQNANEISKLNYSKVDNCVVLFLCILFVGIWFFVSLEFCFFAVQINGSIFKQKDCKKADSLVRKKNKGLFFQIKQKKNSLYSFMLHGFGASFFLLHIAFD